jgi:endonuclease/exonuclease/phosphatase (EEP) superfamily protein YafD
VGDNDDSFKSMKIVLILLSFNLCLSVCHGSGLKSIWWNVARLAVPIGESLPQTSEEIERNSEVNRELISIISNENPDVLMIGEAVPTAFSESFKAKAREVYPYQQFFRYNPSDKVFGFYILAKVPPKNIVKQPLHWFPLNLEAEYKDKWLSPFPDDPHSRDYIQLDFETNEGNLSVVPIHLMMPWVQMIDQKGVLKASFAMFYDASHPQMIQLQNLIKKLRDLKNSGVSFFAMGDFNFPKKVLSQRTMGFFFLSTFFDELGSTGGTFKVTKYQIRTPLDLDQAYGSGIENAVLRRLSYSHSDHFPIQLTF